MRLSGHRVSGNYGTHLVALIKTMSLTDGGKKMLICKLTFFISMSSAILFTYMYSVIRYQHKIFKSVIISLPVKMVNYLFRCKEATNMFFHDQSMFPNIFTIYYKRMIRSIYHYIAIFISPSSTSPVRVFFPTIFTKSTLRHLSSLFNRHYLALFHNNIIELGGYKVKYHSE